MWSTLAALEEQILDAPAPRTADQRKETVGEVFSQDRFQQRLVKQMIEVRNDPVEQSFELPVPQMAEQLVDVPKIVTELAVSSGPGERDTTDDAASPVDVLVGEARRLGMSQRSTAKESEVEGSSGEAGSSS